MTKLDKKARWLFFMQYVAGITFTIAILSITIIPIKILLPKSFSLLPSALLIILGILASYYISKLAWQNWEYDLTADGLVVNRGIIWKSKSIIPYDRIQNVDIFRGVTARLLGLSVVSVQTAGYAYAPKRNSWAEGTIPGVSIEEAENLRKKILSKIKSRSRNGGL